MDKDRGQGTRYMPRCHQLQWSVKPLSRMIFPQGKITEEKEAEAEVRVLGRRPVKRQEKEEESAKERERERREPGEKAKGKGEAQKREGKAGDRGEERTESQNQERREDGDTVGNQQFQCCRTAPIKALGKGPRRSIWPGRDLPEQQVRDEAGTTAHVPCQPMHSISNESPASSSTSWQFPELHVNTEGEPRSSSNYSMFHGSCPVLRDAVSLQCF